MALLGRPKMGDITRAQLRIKESKEFKVRASLIKLLNISIHLEIFIPPQTNKHTQTHQATPNLILRNPLTNKIYCFIAIG